MNKYLFPLLFLLIFLIFLKPIDTDGDFFQHANIGRFVFEHHSLPQIDNLSFTALGKPYVSYAWATGVIFYALYTAFGANAISVFVALVAVFTFILLYVFFKHLDLSPIASFTTLATGALLISTRWPSRPEIMTYPFVITLLLIDQVKDRRSGIVLLIPPVILLWANFYGSSVLVGLVILALLFFKNIWKRTKKMSAFSICTLISYPLALVNGYGLRSVFFMQLIPKMTAIHGDWSGLLTPLQLQPPNYNHLLNFQYTIFFYLLYLLAFVALLVMKFRKAWRHPVLLLLSLGLFIPFSAARVVPLSVILTLPLFGLLLSAQLENKQWLGVVIGSLALLSALLIHPPSWGQDLQIFSPRLVTFLKEHAISGKALNSQRVGSFLSYHLAPNILVYTDTRDDLFIGTETLENLQDAFSLRKDIVPLLDTKSVDIVVADLSETTSYRKIFYSPEWVVVFIDDIYLVAVRSEMAKEKKLPTFSAIDLYSPDGTKTGAKATDANQEYFNIWSANPSTNNTFNLVRSDKAIGNYDAAIELLKHLEFKGKPSSVLFALDRDSLLSELYFEKKDCPMTKQYLDKTKREASGKLIFSPFASIHTTMDKDYAFYYLVCEHNPLKAGVYLQAYLSRKDIRLEEKTTAVKQFNLLKLQVP